MRSFCSDRKKVRGQRHKLRKLLRDIDGLTPFESESNRLYEHFHVPSGTWLNSPSTAGTVKTAFCKAWLEHVSVLFRRNQRIYHSAELLPFSASRCLESPKSLYFIVKSILRLSGSGTTVIKVGFLSTKEVPLLRSVALPPPLQKWDMKRHFLLMEKL